MQGTQDNPRQFVFFENPIITKASLRLKTKLMMT